MIQLSAAGKRYGHKLLFEGTDWLITNRDRIGLVGANGTGKSTLMKILGGMETLDYGLITASTNHLAKGFYALALARWRGGGVCLGLLIGLACVTMAAWWLLARTGAIPPAW